jgi:NAD(P)-dependent dehydrogenase (short-subunit alcohol dehydrogenase family)
VIALTAPPDLQLDKHSLPLLPRERKGVFASLSARVGSISDNRSRHRHAYRASKALRSQLIRTCSIELASRNKNAVSVAVHPGTVNTAMSKPFPAGVASDKLASAAAGARHLLAVIDRLNAQDSGGLFAWDGQRIPL